MFRWKESWRYELKIPVRNLDISPIGDFFAISGDGFFSIWNRDNPSIFSYSNLFYYSKEQNKNVLASVVKEAPLGNIL